MKRIRLTMSQALVKFLDNQYIECDGVETKFVSGMFGIFGHGCVVGVGQALEQGGHNLKFYQGKNEQNMALAAVAYAKQMDRKAIIPCVSSIGPGATNMVTACGCATANRIPLLVLPGDTFACRQPDPVLQQAEFFDNYGRTVTDAFKGVCHYFDRIIRPEQLMTACLNAMRVLTDPADTGAVCLAMPQDVEGEAYDYPEHFLQKRVWHLDRRPISSSQLERATKLIIEAKKPIIVCGGGVRYSGAENELLEFAEKYNIPIAETQAGKGIIDWKNPLNVGGIGVTGGKAANVIGRDADLVIGVGTRFSDFTTSSKWLFNENRKVLGINVCPFDAYKMDAEAIVADAKEAVKALISSCEGYKSEYTNEIKEAKDEWDKIVDEYYSTELEGGLNQTLALGIINEFMDDDRQVHFRVICKDYSGLKTVAHTIWNTVIQIWVMKLTVRLVPNLQSLKAKFTLSAVTVHLLWATVNFILHCKKDLKSMFAFLIIWVGDVLKIFKIIKAQILSVLYSEQEIL